MLFGGGLQDKKFEKGFPSHNTVSSSQHNQYSIVQVNQTRQVRQPVLIWKTLLYVEDDQ